MRLDHFTLIVQAKALSIYVGFRGAECCFLEESLCAAEPTPTPASSSAQADKCLSPDLTLLGTCHFCCEGQVDSAAAHVQNHFANATEWVLKDYLQTVGAASFPEDHVYQGVLDEHLGQ